MTRSSASTPRLVVLVLALFALALFAAGCGDDEEEGGGDGGEQPAAQVTQPDCGDACTIGISVPEAQNPFYLAFSGAMKEQLDKQGHTARVVSADSDVPEQIDGINDLLASDVDLLLISPIDENGPVPAFRSAQQQDVPVINYLRTLNPEQQEQLSQGFVGFSLEESGKLKGEWLVENAEPGPVAMLLGPAGASFAVEQERGFKEVIEPAGFEVVFEQNNDQTREAGVQLAEDALTAHPDLTAIYASNDDVALGAAQAVKAAGKAGDVLVLGLNGAPPAMQAVADGSLAMTVALDPIGGAEKVVEIVNQYLESGDIPAVTPIEQAVVDKTNVKEFLQG